MIRALITTVAIGITVCACGPQRPAIDPQLDSGITSSNGGGQRQTVAVPNISVGPNGTTTGRAPSSAGAAY